MLTASAAQTCTDLPPAFVSCVTRLVTVLAIAFYWSVGNKNLGFLLLARSFRDAERTLLADVWLGRCHVRCQFFLHELPLDTISEVHSIFQKLSFLHHLGIGSVQNAIGSIKGHDGLVKTGRQNATLGPVAFSGPAPESEREKDHALDCSTSFYDEAYFVIYKASFIISEVQFVISEAGTLACLLLVVISRSPTSDSLVEVLPVVVCLGGGTVLVVVPWWYLMVVGVQLLWWFACEACGLGISVVGQTRGVVLVLLFLLTF
ncbi:hypothetical protein Taro_033098 [Colocasia esculenta]|uniref:Transmembrane protein n=1 Tax=Colocasia esculenta TaxID=4460 RepID=A0A843VZ65_COLES|nr:hypothetical protein [Colocasia esculenta]